MDNKLICGLDLDTLDIYFFDKNLNKIGKLSNYIEMMINHIQYFIIINNNEYKIKNKINGYDFDFKSFELIYKFKYLLKGIYVENIYDSETGLMFDNIPRRDITYINTYKDIDICIYKGAFINPVYNSGIYIQDKSLIFMKNKKVLGILYDNKLESIYQWDDTPLNEINFTEEEINYLKEFQIKQIIEEL